MGCGVGKPGVRPHAPGSHRLARGLRLAAAIFWYDKGLISQGKGAEIAGLTRYNRLKSSDFLALNSSWDRMPLRSNSANRSIFAKISVS